MTLTDALNGLRETLQADGADLEMVARHGSSIELRLVFGADACQDCILSKDVIASIVLRQLQDSDSSVERVTIIDPRLAT